MKVRWRMRCLVHRLRCAGLLVAATAAGLLTVPSNTRGAPLGTVFTYQGRLTEANTSASGDFDLQFSLWDEVGSGSPPVGGSQIGTTICADNVGLVNGLFSVELDFGPAAFNGDARFLEISVRPGAVGDCTETSAYTVLSPRQPLTAAPYALFSAGPWQLNGSDIFYNAGNVGIGWDFPTNRLEVRTNSGTAVYGLQTASTGATYGVRGQSNSLSGTGVSGSATAASTAVNYGVYGSSASAAGRGVFGIVSATSGTPYGVRGEAQAPDGAAVYGVNNATSGVGAGVYGVSNAPAGSGVYARGNYSAVNGQVLGISGAGVLGFSSPAAGTTFGVWGFAVDASDYGVYCTGRLLATGTKSFRIDHPADPERKYLNHYCAEGPEPLNLYSGIVVTDSAGIAWVELPAYFQQINRDFRYALTVVDDTDSAGFVQAKVAREIRNNRFKIRSSAPHTKVSWQVTAARNDLWTQKYGAPVEVDKPQGEQGRYQHPELYGQPPELGMIHEPNLQRPLPGPASSSAALDAVRP